MSSHSRSNRSTGRKAIVLFVALAAGAGILFLVSHDRGAVSQAPAPTDGTNSPVSTNVDLGLTSVRPPPVHYDDNPSGLGDIPRPTNSDMLLLGNGDKLTGTILNESFGIRTSYAPLKFDRRVLACIDFDRGTNKVDYFESIITVNSNHFSGFLDNPVFSFKLQNGPQIEVRREKVRRALFRARDDERDGMPQRQFILLKNGDYFSGKVLGDKMSLATTYAKVPLNLQEAESVTVVGGQNPRVKVALTNHDQLQGVLEAEDIDVDLDVGPKLKLYLDRVGIIYCREGYVPDLSPAPSNLFQNITINLGLAALEDTYTWKEAAGGLRIETIAESSPWFTNLVNGDMIIKVDGRAPDRLLWVTSLQHLLDGSIPEMSITVKRGDQMMDYKLHGPPPRPDLFLR